MMKAKALINKNLSGDEIANVNFYDDIAHVLFRQVLRIKS